LDTVSSKEAATLADNGHLEERIRQRAYELFLERGGHYGNPEQDWLRAEAELRNGRVA
jgi:hypothetical protein